MKPIRKNIGKTKAFSFAEVEISNGAKLVFVDVRPDTMNMDEKLIEAAITEKTKVIAPVGQTGRQSPRPSQ